MAFNLLKQLFGTKPGQMLLNALYKAAPVATPVLAQVLLAGGGKPDLTGVVALANTGLAALAAQHPDPVAQIAAAEAQQYLTAHILGAGAPVQVLQLPASLPAPQPMTSAPVTG